MGEAILKGLLDNVLTAQDIICVDKSQESLDRISKAYQVVCSAEISAIKDCDVVLLAVKPQNMDEVLPLLGKVISEKTLIISIAVGITSSFIVKNLGISKAAVVRAMPNTPALVGKGVTGLAKMHSQLEVNQVKSAFIKVPSASGSINSSQVRGVSFKISVIILSLLGQFLSYAK